jgi:hypothetical protein
MANNRIGAGVKASVTALGPKVDRRKPGIATISLDVECGYGLYHCPRLRRSDSTLNTRLKIASGTASQVQNKKVICGHSPLRSTDHHRGGQPFEPVRR